MAWLEKAKRVEPISVEKKSTLYSGGGMSRKPQISYNESWGIDRTLKEAFSRVTWVYRCVDAIASNAAKVPLHLRQGDPHTGKIIEGDPLLPLLNARTNAGETSFVFRYRVTSQLLLSNRGVFIEIIKNKGNDINSLRLLDPQLVEPIPHADNFVSGYRVTIPIRDSGGKVTGTKEKTLPPEKVIWIRKPHPFDEYRSQTALESVGLAVETDWLAKMYNRNFLLNDGRPGGMVVIKGDASEEDKEELRSRFRGNVQMAGRIAVISSDDGADFVDTAVTPRDAQYTESRESTKNEILLGFGVSESILSNASGRTFDNAEIERLIFWQETMIPHLELIVRALDELHDKDSYYVAPNLQYVDVLQRMDMKRKEFHLKEFDAGGIVVDEYREASGREPVSGDHGQILWIPKTRVPYGMLDGSDLPEDVTTPENNEGKPPNSGAGEDIEDDDPVEREDDRIPELPATDSANKTIEKIIEVEKVVTKTEYIDSSVGWSKVAQGALASFYDRQVKVTAEKAQGAKLRKIIARRSKAIENGDSDDFSTKSSIAVEAVYDKPTWDAQLSDIIEPLFNEIVKAYGLTEAPASQENIKGTIDLLQKTNTEIKECAETALAHGLLDDASLDSVAVAFKKSVEETILPKAFTRVDQAVEGFVLWCQSSS